MTDLTYKIMGKDYNPAQLLKDVSFLRGRADKLTRRRKFLESGIQYARNPSLETTLKERFLRQELGYETGPRTRIRSHQIGKVFLERFLDSCKPLEDSKYIAKSEEAKKRVSLYTLQLMMKETRDNLEEKYKAESQRRREENPELVSRNHLNAIGLIPTEEEIMANPTGENITK